MRFPWQKRKVEQPTDFPLKLNTDNLNWCRDARLLLIEYGQLQEWLVDADDPKNERGKWHSKMGVARKKRGLESTICADVARNTSYCPQCTGMPYLRRVAGDWIWIGQSRCTGIAANQRCHQCTICESGHIHRFHGPVAGASVLRSLCNCRRRQFPCRWKWKLFLGCSRRIFQCRGYRTSLVQ